MHALEVLQVVREPGPLKDRLSGSLLVVSQNGGDQISNQDGRFDGLDEKANRMMTCIRSMYVDDAPDTSACGMRPEMRPGEAICLVG